MSNAVLLNADEDGIAESGRRLCAGSLVAFPTETVYGLGANACLEPVSLAQASQVLSYFCIRFPFWSRRYRGTASKIVEQLAF